MKYRFRIITCLFAVMFTAGICDAYANAVDSIPVPRKKRPKPIKHEISFGGRLNTDGWSLFVDRGKVRAPDKTTDYYYNLRFWQLEFAEKKHPMEIKRSNTVTGPVDAAKPFIFGKINNFYTFKLGYGQRKLIAGRPKEGEDLEQGTVSIHWVYLGGLSVGLEKPYYIDAYVPDNGTFVLQSITYDESLRNSFIDQNNIVGSSGFGQGLGETSIVPGIHVKTGLHFDFAVTKKNKMAIETGLNLEMYSRAIPMMVGQKDRPYFTNLYVSFQLGKRWQEKNKSSRYR